MKININFPPNTNDFLKHKLKDIIKKNSPIPDGEQLVIMDKEAVVLLDKNTNEITIKEYFELAKIITTD